jgi:hypothetical protein
MIDSPGAKYDVIELRFENEETAFELLTLPTPYTPVMHAGKAILPELPSLPAAATVAMPTDLRRLTATM